MKAIIEKNETYKITGEKGAFFVTENNNGKIKMFEKQKVSVIEIEEMPKVKSFKKMIATKSQLERNFNEFNNKLNYSLSQETGRTGTTEFLKSI
jgi:hypothetical protein